MELTIANSLWVHLDRTTVLPSFTRMDQNFYGATIGDLAGAPGPRADFSALTSERA